MRLSKRGLSDLVGRRIIAVDARPFSDGRGGTVYDPELTLDDGSRVSFGVLETEGDQYGIALYWKEHGP